MTVLGIETSCDETAAAVVENGRWVRSNVVYSQVARHRAFGGVVPEVAARCHVEQLPAMAEQAVAESGMKWSDLDAVAVTRGPGLATSLLVGLAGAKGLALSLGLPLLQVNHLEAHLYSIFLGDVAPRAEDVCPLLVLLVTGGNTGLIQFNGVGDYHVLGQTLDDAAGEALDKGAMLLGLGYPGGPVIEQMAQAGDPSYLRFPRGLEQPRGGPMPGPWERDLCFSFSGVKTALRYHLDREPGDRRPERLPDVTASYQDAVFDALVLRVERALACTGLTTLGCVGGVARNRNLRARLERTARSHGARLVLADPAYCTDNAAMIAGLAGRPRGAFACDDPWSADIAPSFPIGSPAA
jgi:N6-L-threonylcarbamoyladenine synthase